MASGRKSWLCAFIIVGAAGSIAHATNVGGPIFSNTTWTLASSPYVVTNSIIVGSDATLTIQAGVVVKVNNGLGIQIGSPEGFGNGSIVAVGTAAQPILFTSNDPTPAPGKWNNILLTDLAVDATFNGSAYESGAILEHVIVEYAGSGSDTSGAVTVQNSSPYLNAVEVRLASRSGIRIDGAATPAQHVNACNLHDCSVPSQYGGGLYLVNGQNHQITNNTVHNNTAAAGGGVFLQATGSATITGNTVSANSGGGLYSTGSTSALFQNNTFSNNTAGSYAGMYCDGTSVQILSNTISGNSGGSYVGCYCGSSNLVFSNNVVTNNAASGSYGGSYLTGSGAQISGNQWTGNSAFSRAGVHVDGSNLTFDNNQVNDNDAIGATSDIGGAEIGGSANTITDNSFSGNTCQRNAAGLYVTGSGHTFLDNTIDGNDAGDTGGGVYIDATNTVWTHNEITNNGADVRGGGIYNHATGNTIAGDSGASVFNTIVGNSSPLGSAIYHDVPNGANGNLQAQFVCWGTIDSDLIQQSIFDFFDNSALGIVIASQPVADCGAPNPCPSDLDGDGSTGASDLATLLGQWASPGSADLDGDGTVGSTDLGTLLGGWGPCP